MGDRRPTPSTGSFKRDLLSLGCPLCLDRNRCSGEHVLSGHRNDAVLDGHETQGRLAIRRRIERYLVEHASLTSAGAATVTVQARRHPLDFGEMTPAETADFGSLLHRLVPAVKAATAVGRVYNLALMERVAHFHLWHVPKKDEGDLRGVEYMAQQPPLTA
jgi:hypothetical protein